MKKLGDIKEGDIIYGYNVDKIMFIEYKIKKVADLDYEKEVIFTIKGENEDTQSYIDKSEFEYFSSDKTGFGYGVVIITPNFEIVEKALENKIKEIQEWFEDIKKLKPRRQKIKSFFDKN